MAALDIFDIYFNKYMKEVSTLCGFDITDRNYKPSKVTYFFGGSILIGMACLLYTVIAKDFEIALNAGFGFGITIQVRMILIYTYCFADLTY